MLADKHSVIWIVGCARVSVTAGAMRGISVTARGTRPGDARGVCVRDRPGGGPAATSLDLMSREEKRENQTYWKARIGYGFRWLAESVFSAFKRLFGEHLMALKWDNIVQEVRLKVIQYNIYVNPPCGVMTATWVHFRSVPDLVRVQFIAHAGRCTSGLARIRLHFFARALHLGKLALVQGLVARLVGRHRV